MTPGFNNIGITGVFEKNFFRWSVGRENLLRADVREERRETRGLCLDKPFKMCCKGKKKEKRNVSMTKVGSGEGLLVLDEMH